MTRSRQSASGVGPTRAATVLALVAAIAAVTPAHARSSAVVAVLDLPKQSTPQPVAGSAGPDIVQQLSRDGRFLLYTRQERSAAQVELFDRETGHNEILSATRAGAPGNGDSWEPVMTPDARYIAFYSLASNLVRTKLPTTPHAGVFILDRRSDRLRLLNAVPNMPEALVTAHAERGLDITADGALVVFRDAAGYMKDEPIGGGPYYYAVNTHGRPTVRHFVVGPTGKPLVDSHFFQETSDHHQLSADGRYFVFTSVEAANTGDPENHPHIYVYDARRRHVILLTRSTSPRQVFDHPSIDARGRLVTYESCTSLNGSGSEQKVPYPGGVLQPQPLPIDPSGVNSGRCEDSESMRSGVPGSVSGDVWVAGVGQADARHARAYASGLLSAGYPTISPDGSTVYFLGMNRDDLENGDVSLWRWVLKTNSVVRLTGLICPAAETGPSPDCYTGAGGTANTGCATGGAVGSCPVDANDASAFRYLSTDEHGRLVLMRTWQVLSAKDRNGYTPSIYLLSRDG